MTAADIAARLGATVRAHQSSWEVCCPAHEDGRPSLSVSTGKNGNVLLHCHANCSLEAVLAAANLTLADLMSDSPSTNGHAPTIIATYDYTDEAGRLLFQVVRMQPKGFRQRKPDGHDGWEWKLGDVRRVLYRLPEILKAKIEGRPVYVVEGEKDVGTLETWGLTATTCPGGAGKWRPEFTEQLQGLKVVIIPDRDGPGEAHAQKIMEAIPDATLLRLPSGKDVTEWAGLGGSGTALLALKPDVPTANAQDERYTDLGNGRRWARLHGATFRYCKTFGRWYHYAEGFWSEDATQRSDQAAKATIEAMHTDALTSDDAKKLRKWALESESAGHIRAMIHLAQSELPITPDAFDTQPHLLNLANGTLDLRSESLLPHRPDHLLTTKLPFQYDPNAACPRWESFLHRAFDGHQDMLEFIARAVGYSLTGSTGEQCFFFLHGSGANGKSVFLRTLLALFGNAGRTANFSTFLHQRDAGRPRQDLARLAGARLVVAAEAGDGQRFDEELLKSITGGERITARKLYADDFEFTPQFTLWLAANHRPTIRGADLAIWRRVCLIPFAVTIPEEERIPLDSFCAILSDELPGILNWALAGHRDWAERGLSKPASVIVATEEYRENSDPLGDWMDRYCQTGPLFSCSAAKLYESYKKWCSETGEDARSQKWLGGGLRDRGFHTVKSHGTTSYIGLTASTTVVVGEDGG